MKRRFLLVGLLSVIATSLALVAVLAIRYVDGGRRSEPMSDRAADGVFTPEERTVTAIPQPDGTLSVEEKLVFDAGEGTDRPLRWAIGGTAIGWKGPNRVAQYGVIPQVRDIRAREISSGSPGPDLAVTHGPSKVVDPFFDDHLYQFAPPGAVWHSGRHAVQISYTLAGTYVVVENQAMLVLPLAFVHGPQSTQPSDITRVRIAGDQPLQCLATNVDFAQHRLCLGGDAGRLTHQGNLFDSMDAVGVANPGGVSAQPAPAAEKERPR